MNALRQPYYDSISLCRRLRLPPYKASGLPAPDHLE